MGGKLAAKPNRNCKLQVKYIVLYLNFVYRATHKVIEGRTGEIKFSLRGPGSEKTEQKLVGRLCCYLN